MESQRIGNIKRTPVLSVLRGKQTLGIFENDVKIKMQRLE